MSFRIRARTPADLTDYAGVPIRFEGTRVADVVCESPRNEFRLVERPVLSPYVKDYDERPENRPLEWPRRFDLSRWALFSATIESEWIGAAAVVANSAEIAMLEGRTDRALLWDLRVAPPYRRSGCGSALCDAAEAWARTQGCSELEVETQNINLPACRFYAKQGFRLQVVSARAYADCPEELQLLWFKSLAVW